MADFIVDTANVLAQDATIPNCTPPIKSTRLAVSPCPASGAVPPSLMRVSTSAIKAPRPAATKPDHSASLSGNIEKPVIGVERQAQHLPERVLGLAGLAREAAVGHADLAEANPG